MIQGKGAMGKALLPGAGVPPAEDGPAALIKAVSAAVRRNLLPLTLWVLACLLLAFFYARSLPPVYTAASTLILEAPRQFRAAPGEPVADTSLDLNRVDSELQVIRSERMQRLVFDELGLAANPELQSGRSGSDAGAGASPEAEPAADPAADPGGADAAAPSPGAAPVLPVIANAKAAPVPPPAGTEAAPADPAATRAHEMAFARFQDRFGARRIGQSYVIEIYYASADPGLAARIANAGASAYLLQSVSFKAAAASGGAEFVQSRLDTLSDEVAAAAAAVRQGTLPEIQIPDANARIIGAALVPLAPSAPRVKLIAALGAVLGLLGGLFVIALGSALDRRVDDGRKLAAAGEPGLLARIPATSAPEGRQPEGPFAMALRDLRTAVDLAFGAEFQNRNRCIALVSWQAGAGCSTLAMSLAHMMHQADRAVVVVDADLRGGRRGLSARHRDAPAETAPGGLRLLDAGGVTLVPVPALDEFSETLADAREPGVAELFRQLRSWGDVLIDLPPLAESADARALARQADAVILVATPRSLLDEVADAARQLEAGGVAVLGVVLNDPGRSGPMARLRRLLPAGKARAPAPADDRPGAAVETAVPAGTEPYLAAPAGPGGRA